MFHSHPPVSVICPTPFLFPVSFTTYNLMSSSPLLHNLPNFILFFALSLSLSLLILLSFCFPLTLLFSFPPLSSCRLVTLENSPAVTPELLRIFQNMSALLGEMRFLFAGRSGYVHVFVLVNTVYVMCVQISFYFSLPSNFMAFCINI